MSVDEDLMIEGMLMALDHDPAPGWQEVHHFCWKISRARGTTAPRPDDVALWFSKQKVAS